MRTLSGDGLCSAGQPERTIPEIARDNKYTKGMNVFETILKDLVIAGKIVGPIFIHSAHGTAILNASEEGLQAIVGAYTQAQTQKQGS